MDEPSTGTLDWPSEMKRLPRPRVTDVANLRALTRNRRAGSFPVLRTRWREIVQSYLAYWAVNGSSVATGKPVPLAFTIELADALRTHYTRPPDSLKEVLKHLRERGSPDVCPMCGSLGTGTLDHVFPKATYPEFAVFSSNLVPACLCNSKRTEDNAAEILGGRVLHPYFDDWMNQRLVRAVVNPTDEGVFARPVIGLTILLEPDDNRYQSVKYHFENVLMRTQVLAHCDATWPKLARRPEHHFIEADGAVTLTEFVAAVSNALYRTDVKYGTPNNWESMLLAGIAAEPLACSYLYRRLIDLRNGVAAPDDV